MNYIKFLCLRTLQNYTRWQFVRNFLTVLDSASVDAFMQFENTITNNGIPEREEMCVKKVQEFLPLAIWRPYAEFVFSDEARVNQYTCRPVNYMI